VSWVSSNQVLVRWYHSSSIVSMGNISCIPLVDRFCGLFGESALGGIDKTKGIPYNINK